MHGTARGTDRHGGGRGRVGGAARVVARRAYRRGSLAVRLHDNRMFQKKLDGCVPAVFRP